MNKLIKTICTLWKVCWKDAKNCFIALFIESTEEIARKAVEQHIRRTGKKEW